MTVINSKITAFWPVLMLSVLWLYYVEDNGNSVFVVVADKTLIGISCICSYDTISFEGAFGLFIVRNHNTLSGLDFERILINLVFYH